MTAASQTGVFGQDNALQSLLNAINRKTAPALKYDLELLKAGALQNRDLRVLYIAFMVGWYEMALPVLAMRELGTLPAVTPLPYLPPWIKGIVQIRSEIFSVVDFQELFHLKKDRRNARKYSYVLFEGDDLQFCLQVDRITGILSLGGSGTRLDTYNKDEKQDCAELLEFSGGVFVRGQRRVLVLDSETLGSSPKIRQWR